MLHVPNRAVQFDGIPTPTVQDQHGDESVTPRPAVELPGCDEWLDQRGDHELSQADADYLAAKDHAERYSLGLYKLTCDGFAPAYEVADSADKAWPQARKRGWAKGGGAVGVEILLTPETAWGSYPVDVLSESGWKHLCHIRARSARAAVTIISAKYPNHRLRAGSLHSVEAHRRIDRTRALAS